MDKRPVLSRAIKISDFKNYYWTKKELITFCKQNKISTYGSKMELVARVEYYLSTGEQINKATNKVKKTFYDSDNTITSQTTVVGYRNDLKTRLFFVSKIGTKFKFNYYLRSFAKQENDGTLTYGDLVRGYKDSLKNKKIIIDKQFEYNQFQRDFYKNNPQKTRNECNDAWKLVKLAPGGTTYKDYLILIKGQAND